MKKKKSNAEGKRPIVIHKTIHKTINNYFGPTTGPTTAPEAPSSEPPPLFPREEKEICGLFVNGGLYRLVISKNDGTLSGDCRNCKQKNFVAISNFAPVESMNNVRTRPEFFEAVEAYEAAHAARDLEAAREARFEVEQRRITRCQKCAITNNTLTGEEKACKEFYDETRLAECTKNDGCCNPECIERGPLAVYVLQGDHIDPNTKVEKLSCKDYWSTHGGVAAMKLELPKLQWPCAFCHALEKTSSSGNRNGDPALMPNGKCSGTKEEVDQYMAKHQSKIRYPKQQYVDAEKLRRAACLKCARSVTAETAVAFHFDHRDERTKMIGADTLAGINGGVGGLVRNNTKRAKLENINTILDDEMVKCDLLCYNCHHRKTWGYPMRNN